MCITECNCADIRLAINHAEFALDAIFPFTLPTLEGDASLGEQEAGNVVFAERRISLRWCPSLSDKSRDRCVSPTDRKLSCLVFFCVKMHFYRARESHQTNVFTGIACGLFPLNVSGAFHLILQLESKSAVLGASAKRRKVEVRL